MKLADTGLRKQPFRTHGKPLVVVPYAAQRNAIRFLDDTRSHKQGLGLFHGPPLSGKTTIVQQFAKSMPREQAVAIIDGANADPSDLLNQILNQYGYDLGVESAGERFNMIRVLALQQASKGQPPVLAIENIHKMNPIMLEMICELAELSVDSMSALRMILVSDRPMLPIIEAPAMESMESRLTGKFLLKPLTRTETAKYAHKKLRSGGCNDPTAVMPAAVCNRLHSASGGWPGVIDRLAMMALANAEEVPLLVEHIPEKLTKEEKPPNVIDPVPRLILTYKHRTLGKITLEKSRYLIGRNALCDIVIDHEWISRQHAIIIRNEKSSVIVDLKSRNGIYVNNERVKSRVLINNDIISLGDHRLKFTDPSATRRTSLRGAGFDNDTIAESIRDFRKGWLRRLRSTR